MRFETMPSRPKPQTWRKMAPPSPLDRHLRVTPVTSGGSIPWHMPSMEDSHANLLHPRELHGSGSSQREGLSQAGRSIQGDGEEARVTVRDIYWTQGRYDVVTITEAPDDLAAT